MSRPDFEAKMASLKKYLQKQKEIVEAMDPDEVWHAKPGSMQALTGMEHWWPAVSRIARVPLTVKVPVPDRCNLLRLLDGEKPLHWDRFFDMLMGSVRMLRTALPSMPAVFMRTSYTSGKHGWMRTCYLDSVERDAVTAHLLGIVEFSAIIDQPVDCFWVREFIETVPAFTAFGGMPITREYRLRVVDGQVVHVQPYWPEEAFEKEQDLPENWHDLLRKLWLVGASELAPLKAKTSEIGLALGGDWSVDWLQSADGSWFCTDLAAGPLSYWWNAKEADFVVEDGAHA